MNVTFSVTLFHPYLPNPSTNLNETLDISFYDKYTWLGRKKFLKSCIEKKLQRDSLFHNLPQSDSLSDTKKIDSLSEAKK